MRSFSDNFMRILKDDTSGSVRLARNFLELIVVENYTTSDIGRMCNALVDQFPEMAVIQNIAKRLKLTSRNLVLEANKILKVLDSSDERIAKKAQQLLPKSGNVLTISQSNTVYRIFEFAAESENFQNIFISLGYPQKDGLDHAKKLMKMGHIVTVFTDMAYSYYVSKADMIFVGADQICKDRFINRNGTRGLAIIAQHFETPFYVAATKMKWVDSCIPPSTEKVRTIAGVQVLEPIFEFTENTLVTKFIDED